jgi:hypothetical protein
VWVRATGCGHTSEALTDSSGSYTIDADITPACNANLTVKIATLGFVDAVRQVAADETRAQDFVLVPTGVAAADLSGEWTLTVSASPSCANALPPEAQSRQYNATLTQVGVRVTVDFSSPTMAAILDPAVEVGTLIDSTLSFWIIGNTGGIVDVGIVWDYPEWVDRLSDGTIVAPYGLVNATLSGSEIRGSMNGAFEYWKNFDGSFIQGPPAAICRAPDHGFILRRRS